MQGLTLPKFFDINSQFPTNKSHGFFLGEGTSIMRRRHMKRYRFNEYKNTDEKPLISMIHKGFHIMEISSHSVT